MKLQEVAQQRSFLERLYLKLRDAAEEWARVENMDEHCVFNGDSFWVQLVRPSNVKTAAFRAAAERALQQMEEAGMINDLLPVKLTITKSGTAYDIEGEPL